MTNEQNGNNSTLTDILSVTHADLDNIWARTSTYLASPQSRFTAGGGATLVGLYDRDLAGWPFIFVSAPTYRTRKGKFGDQETCEVYVQRIDGHLLGEPELASLQGRYILNRMKGMSVVELVGSVIWTLARNPEWPALPSGKQPLGLAIYDPASDQPEIVDSEDYRLGHEFPSETATSGTPYARIGEAVDTLKATGPLPPWQVQEDTTQVTTEESRRGPGRPPTKR
jgi:hypothetical protein